MIKFAFWPDGDFCELSIVENFTWKSDDYEIVEFKTIEEAEVHGSKIIVKPHQELLGLTNEKLLELCPEATHQHYKGGLYCWIKPGGENFAHSKETDGLLCIYSHVFPYEKKVWARPAIEFFGEVELDNGDKVERFRHLFEEVKF